MKVPKLIIIGVDGAGFELILPWLEKNKLPNLKRMVGNGVSGDLLSCLPPVTCPNWKCYSTGRNPGKLGLFWWENIDIRNRRLVVPSAGRGKTTDFWHLLNNGGYRTAVINTPLTYPPCPTNGYLIAGGLDASEHGFCYPHKLEKELHSRFAYRVNNPSHDVLRQSHLTQDMLDLIELRFKVAEYLMEKDEIDFVQVTCFYINVLQHFFWNKEPVKQGWQLIDKWAGRYLEKGTNVWIMSDHGSMPVHTELSINRWLEEQGLLLLRNTFSDRMSALGINRERLKVLADTLGVRRFLRDRTSARWRHFIPDKEGTLKGRGKLHKVDWDRSVALGLGQGPIYIIPDKGDARRPALMEELIGKLRELRLPESNTRVAKDVKRADSIYHGPLMKYSPDVVIEYNHGIHISGSVGKKSVFSKPSRWIADNKREGLFIAFGPDMEKTFAVDNLSIMDLAPTILHLFGLPIDADMDGMIRKEIFSKGSEAAARDIIMAAGSGPMPGQHGEDLEENEIARRLRELGYLE